MTQTWLRSGIYLCKTFYVRNIAIYSEWDMGGGERDNIDIKKSLFGDFGGEQMWM